MRIDKRFCDKTSEELIENCEKQNFGHEDCFNRFFNLTTVTDMVYKRDLETEFSIAFGGESDIIFMNKS